MNLNDLLNKVKGKVSGQPAPAASSPAAPKRGIPAGLAAYEAAKKAGKTAQTAQPGQPTPTSQPTQGQPDTAVLQSLAQVATSLDPEALGMILFNALNAAKLPLNAQGLTQLEGPTKPQMPQMQTPPAF